MRWLVDDMNRPSRSDYYAMQIAAVMGGGEGSVNSLKIPFDPVSVGGQSNTKSGMTKEHATAYSKAKWCTVAGLKQGMSDVNRN